MTHYESKPSDEAVDAVQHLRWEYGEGEGPEVRRWNVEEELRAAYAIDFPDQLNPEEAERVRLLISMALSDLAGSGYGRIEEDPAFTGLLKLAPFAFKGNWLEERLPQSVTEEER